MNELKRLVKTTGVYFLGTVGTKLISFLLLPLYTAFLLPSQYGQYDVNITYATLISSVCFLDIWTGIMKYMFENKENEQQFNVVYCGIAIFSASAVLYMLLMLAFGFLWEIEYLPGVAAYGFFLCLQNLYGYLARAYGKNLLFIFTGLVSTACNAALNILLLAVWGWDYKALYISFSVGIMMQCAILEMDLRLISHFRKKYLDRDTMKCLLRFSHR